MKAEFQVGGEKINYSPNGFRTAREPFGGGGKLNFFLTLFLKINARWINVLSMKSEILKEVEESQRFKNI